MKTKGRFDEDELMTSTTTPFVIENTRPQSTINHPLSLSISDSQIQFLFSRVLPKGSAPLPMGYQVSESSSAWLRLFLAALLASIGCSRAHGLSIGL
ncbi:hypothetical protein E3N88_18196 [Mikania micrantha]|uniref:Uncharacterized protein n=1 Tax=Mikania micrantha TaxID=192012 RepID=A0A5N6NVF1_9ASTR|nr:hypothetical protein E3N88_18196 [Mikania micrantha]